MGKSIRLWAVLLFALVASVIAASSHADAQAVNDNGSVKLSWHITPIIVLTVTPNYASGYGPTGGAGSGSTPSPGPGASLGGGVVDFGGNVVQGYAYLYRKAVQTSVETNDSGGFTLYAEGASDIQDQTNPGSTIPIDTTLYWLKNSTSNTPFTNATPFEASTAPSCGTGCLTYTGAPPPTATVWTYSSSTIGQPSNMVSQGFDYQLRLYSSPPTDNFSVYIVYTAVGN
jgi:hypothetical protein